jgi:hypothetical protein
MTCRFDAYWSHGQAEGPLYTEEPIYGDCHELNSDPRNNDR